MDSVIDLKQVVAFGLELALGSGRRVLANRRMKGRKRLAA